MIAKLNPKPPIGGLEIGDTVLRYLLLNEEKKILKETFVRLPAGVVVGGRIQDRARLAAALAQLRTQISRRSPINAVVSISAASVYLQTFILPAAAGGKLEEAARLNLQMISPVNIRSAYYDWEIIDPDIPLSRGSNQPLNLLGGFAVKEAIDELTANLEAAGFNAVVIESAPMSLTRVISWQLNDAARPHLVLSLSGDGLDFFILRNGRLYFNYFTSWSALRENGRTEINLANVKNVIGGELRRLTSFYTGRWGELVEDLALVGMADNREIFEFIRKNFTLNLHQIKTNPAVGAALRGLVPRSEDHFISLASVDTEGKFAQNRILEMIRFWRDAAVAVLAGILLIFGAFNLIIARLSLNLSRDLTAAPKINGTISNIGVRQWEEEARIFNNLVDKAAAAEKQSLAWSPLFQNLRVLAGQRIQLKQIQLQQPNLSVTLSGQADSEREILNFKDSLSKEPNFSDISLPLTAIKMDVNGKANFTISFKLKKWP